MNGNRQFDIIVIGGGHAGVEAAWAAANLGARAALITMDPTRIGVMSCNPAIGGLAKGQMVREIDALGGLMGLATDATGIQFRMLNASKGPAVWGPRAQCDKHRYARQVQRMIASRSQITVLGGSVERLHVEKGRMAGVWAVLDADTNAPRGTGDCCGEFSAIDMAEKPVLLRASAVVLTTGTFMRGLMHTGESKTEGGRVGEGSAVGISGALRELGFELGRLKTGTPPRLAAETIDFASLDLQPGDDNPVPFSDMTMMKSRDCNPGASAASDGHECDADDGAFPSLRRFPVQEQRPCYITHTNAAIHDRIRANLHRAPMYNGQIETTGPRYCPSIEDKVVRFADRTSHHIYLEPESLDTNEIYCNGISTSLPADVQDFIVRNLPGCANAKILRYGYAVEYDMVWPHQIDATCMTKRPGVEGLFLAGQINGTSGYEEAAGQGLIAGVNAVRFTRGESMVRLRRDQAYLGVMMDDLVTKTPREPYRMFTSRAEWRLLLRSDNADARLTPLGRELGLVDDARWQAYEIRRGKLEALTRAAQTVRVEGQRLSEWMRRPEADAAAVTRALEGADVPLGEHALIARLVSDAQYAGYIARQQREVAKLARQEATPLPADFDYTRLTGLRREAQQMLTRFRPTTLGQASRIAGVTPADLMLITVTIGR